MAREQNPERHDFYELLWHTGASQTDAVCLTAEDINWNAHTISYCRKKLKSRTGIKPALIRFGDEVAAILRRRPQSGPGDVLPLHDGEGIQDIGRVVAVDAVQVEEGGIQLAEEQEAPRLVPPERRAGPSAVLRRGLPVRYL